jgi:UDP-2,3-diacylglucosamine pyrophosphatase LpxH
VSNKRILLISDLHVPYQHPDTIAFLTAIKKKYKPTRVISVGDEVDKHAMSFHDSDPDLSSAGDELEDAIEQLQPLYKLFPKMDLVDSNHGSMVYRKGKHHGIPRKYLRDYGDILDAPKGWKWSNELLINIPGNNQLLVVHGISKDVMKVVAQRGVCVAQGHYHSEFRIGYLGNPNHLLFGINVGCSIDSKSLAFAYDKLNLARPVVGHGIIIDGLPRLLPMVLNSKGHWNKVVP